MTTSSVTRYVFIDHLRGFIFALMAFDHALHAYAYHWGYFWFFRDYDRVLPFDAFYLFDQCIIMPMLFFIFGMFVLPAVQRNGLMGYAKKRLVKLGIPYILGIPLIVPLLTYPKFHEFSDPNPTYWEYWTSIFFTDRLQAGPFWVLFAILLYSALLIILVNLIPPLLRALVSYVKYMTTHPVSGIISFLLLSAVIFGISDLLWGAPWWIGFGKFFYLQGARFIMNFVYFLLGAGLMASGLLENTGLWKTYANKVPLFGGLMILAAIAYVSYSLSYFDEGAYGSDEIRRLLASGRTIDELWSQILLVLIRTTLLGTLTAFQVLFLLGFFYKYLNQPTPLWQSLAKNAYGIFLFHEAMVVWLQFGLVDVSISPYLKMPIVFVLGLSGAWILNDRLRKLPGFRVVLN